jgi:hypothetical protein
MLELISLNRNFKIKYNQSNYKLFDVIDFKFLLFIILNYGCMYLNRTHVNQHECHLFWFSNPDN